MRVKPNQRTQIHRVKIIYGAGNTLSPDVSSHWVEYVVTRTAFLKRQLEKAPE